MQSTQNHLLELWQQLREQGFRDIAGASLTLQLPLQENFINWLLARGLAEKESPLRSMRVTFRGGSRIGLELDPRLFLLPHIHLELDIQDTVDCSRDPTLRLRVAPESFSSALVLQGANFVRLPPGLNFSNQELTFHLPTLLERGNLSDLVPLLRYILVTGEPGRLLLRIHLVVPLSEE